MRVYVGLETEVKLRFLNHKDLRAWFQTDLIKQVLQLSIQFNYMVLAINNINVHGLSNKASHK